MGEAGETPGTQATKIFSSLFLNFGKFRETASLMLF